MFTGKLKRAYHLGINDELSTLNLLETALEMHILSYPVKVLRAVLHAIPPFPPVRGARTAIRA